MAKPHSNHIDQRKIAELTVSEFSLLIKQIQVDAIEEALKKVIPQVDPDESKFLTTQEAADLIGVSRQTLQEKKSRGLIEFGEDGRIHRTTLAAVKRYLKKFGQPLSQIKRAEQKRREDDEKKKKAEDAIRKSGNRGIT